MKSSDEGIHAGAMGGIWQDVICGFGGVRMLNGQLSISPKLPEKWKKLNYSIIWHGERLEIEVKKKKLTITRTHNDSKPINLLIHDKEYKLETVLKV